MSRELIVVNTKCDFDEMLNILASTQYIAYDVETNGLNTRKDKIIGIALCPKINLSFYLPLKIYSGELKPTELESYGLKRLFNVLKGKKLIMHNASFDSRITKSNYGVDLLDSLYCDTMLLKHTCDEEQPFGLKEIAKQIQEELGLDMDQEANQEQIELKEHLKSVGASMTKDKFELYKGDPNVIGKYAAADADITMRIFEYYNAKLYNDNLQKFFYIDEVMPLYKEVTIPMEERGIAMNAGLLLNTKKEIRSDIERLEQQIQEMISPLLSEFNNWFYDLKYPHANHGVFAQSAAKYYNITLPKTATGNSKLDKKTLDKLPDSVFKNWMQGNVRLPFTDIKSIQQSMHSGYTFNLSSKHHLKKLFFNKLKLEAVSFTDKGNPQVDDEFLESIKDEYEFIPLLIQYNRLNKIEGSYIDRFIEENEDGIFYPSFFQHRTISGRYGSNIQQLPRTAEPGSEADIVVKYNNIIRQLFISRPGFVFVDSDYESLEPHVFAHVSGDEGIKQIFRDGLDFYSKIAIDTEKLEDVSALKTAPNFLGKVNKSARQKAKAYSLGIPYGMQEYALSMHIGVSKIEAAQLVNDYLDAYPQLAAWMVHSDSVAAESGVIAVESGRLRRFPQAVSLVEKYGMELLNSLDLYEKYHEEPMLYEQMKDKRKVLKNCLNNAKNIQIQGLAASIVNRASIAINRFLKQNNINGLIVCQIHDQIVLEVADNQVEIMKSKMQEIMETVYPLSVKLRAPASVGRSFYESH